VRRLPTKRDWANDSADFRALGQCARLLLSDADSCQGVHQFVHQNEGARVVRIGAVAGRGQASGALAFFIFRIFSG